MWDVACETRPEGRPHLSHDLPCPRCGHGMHTYLACGDACDCRPVVLPGSVRAA